MAKKFKIVPMQILVIKDMRKVCACHGCEIALVTADEPIQLIEKCMTSPTVTKYFDVLFALSSR